MANEIKTTEDGYVVQKIFHKDCLKRNIDVSNFRIPKGEHPWLFWKDNPRITKEEMMKARKENTYSDYNLVQDEYYVQEMCQYIPYDPGRDHFAWYDDIRALSGSAGYVRFRDGYVYDTKIVIRS